MHSKEAKPIGRIDVHNHLLPGVDDGCKSLGESIAVARAMIEAGYTHAFCTPHIWPNLPANHSASIRLAVASLQREFDAAGVELRLFPGGELNLRPDFREQSSEAVVTYNLGGKYVLFDFWADRLPDYFGDYIDYLQERNLKVVVAHPERVRAVQLNPELADYFLERGLLLQGNLACLGDPPRTATHQLGREFLETGKYFLLGSDCHGPDTLPVRLAGLRNAIQWMGEAEIDRLTKHNPKMLLDEPPTE